MIKIRLVDAGRIDRIAEGFFTDGIFECGEAGSRRLCWVEKMFDSWCRIEK